MIYIVYTGLNGENSRYVSTIWQQWSRPVATGDLLSAERDQVDVIRQRKGAGEGGQSGGGGAHSGVERRSRGRGEREYLAGGRCPLGYV